MIGSLLFGGRAASGATSEREQRWAALDRFLPGWLQELNIPGLALVSLREGQPDGSAQFGVCEAGKPDPVRADTVFEAASMSKPLFACLVMQQVQAGRLDLDRPVMDCLPEIFTPSQPWQALITPRMLLSHSSGLPNWRSGDENTGPLEIAFKPGLRFAYSGEGYFYLQRLLEQITQEPLQSLADRQLFQPLGMTHSGFVLNSDLRRLRARGHDEQGQPLPVKDYTQANAAYTLYTSAEDFARFLAELMRREHGKGSAAHSLKPAALQAMLAHQMVADDREPIERRGFATGQTVFWGLGWGINTTNQGDIAYHTGTNSTGFRNYCQFSPSRRSGLVLLSNGLSGNRLWKRWVALVEDR